MNSGHNFLTNGRQTQLYRNYTLPMASGQPVELTPQQVASPVQQPTGASHGHGHRKQGVARRRHAQTLTATVQIRRPASRIFRKSEAANIWTDLPWGQPGSKSPSPASAHQVRLPLQTAAKTVTQFTSFQLLHKLGSIHTTVRRACYCVDVSLAVLG